MTYLIAPITLKIFFNYNSSCISIYYFSLLDNMSWFSIAWASFYDDTELLCLVVTFPRRAKLFEDTMVLLQLSRRKLNGNNACSSCISIYYEFSKLDNLSLVSMMILYLFPRLLPYKDSMLPNSFWSSHQALSCSTILRLQGNWTATTLEAIHPK